MYCQADTMVVSCLSRCMPMEQAQPMSDTSPATTTTTDQWAERLEAMPETLGIRPATLFNLLQCPPDNAQDVKQIISLCPMLSARVLALVNSAAFGLPRQIGCVDRAVNLLGAPRTRSLALAHGLRLLNQQFNLPDQLLDQLWTRAVTKACAARTVAEMVAPKMTEKAYALGLIQDIGLPLLVAADPVFYEDYLADDLPAARWLELEADHFGINHAELGYQLLDRWDAGADLALAVAQHHECPAGDAENGTNPPIGQVAVFAASLLPHFIEPMGDDQLIWLNAIHARLLAEQVSSPDALVSLVNEQARKVCARAEPADAINATDLQRRLTDHLVDQTGALIGAICRLESKLMTERQGLLAMRTSAMTDSLTDLLNRRGFEALGKRALEYAHRSGTSVCCMLADIDEFKQYNDQLGHQVGDQVLRAAADLLKQNVRQGDLVGRVGGDEFAVLMLNVDAMRAEELARRLIDGLEGQTLQLPGRADPVELHVSLGAVFLDEPSADLTVEQIVNAADRAMYQRKRNGKRGLKFQYLD